MHWLVGIDVVITCLIGWPDSSFGIISSVDCEKPWLPAFAYCARVHRRSIVGVDHVARGAAAVSDSRRRLSFEPMKLSVGSSSRVFCRPMNTGSVRFSVPSPRLLRRFSGRPGSSSGSGLPTSSGRRPPRSKMRSTLPGCVTCHGNSGRRNGRMPCCRGHAAAVGGGTVLPIAGVPSAM